MQPKYDAVYRALVTSNTDSTNKGLIKVQCPQIGGVVEIRAAEPATPHDPVPNVGTTVWIGFSGGDITKPFYLTNDSFIHNDSSGTFMSLITKTPGTLVDAMATYWVSGLGGQATGASGPFVKFQDTLGTSATDVLLSGSVVKTDLSGNRVSWQAPTMQGSWATGSGVGGSYSNLEWRYDAEDNIHVFGVFHTTNTTPGGIIANGFPAVSIGGNVGVVGPAVGINVSNRNLPLYLNGSGELRISILGTVAANDTFMVNAKVPIGDLS